MVSPRPKLGGPDYFEDGAKIITFESDKIAGRELVLTTVDEDAGRLDVKQTKDAYHGFYIHWWPDPAKSGTPGGHMKLQVK